MKTKKKPYLLQFQQNLNLFVGMVEATPHVFRSFVFHSRPSFSVDHIVPGVPSLVSRRKMTLKLNYIYMKVL
jgi:hypothetical protein